MRARLHHGSINVTDTERSLAFYSGLLGMAQLDRPDFGFGGAWLDAGDGRQVHLIETSVPPDLGQHLAFFVDDLDAAAATLTSAGVSVGPITTVPGTKIRQTHVSDPDGNRIELTTAPLPQM